MVYGTVWHGITTSPDPEYGLHIKHPIPSPTYTILNATRARVLSGPGFGWPHQHISGGTIENLVQVASLRNEVVLTLTVSNAFSA